MVQAEHHTAAGNGAPITNAEKRVGDTSRIAIRLADRDDVPLIVEIFAADELGGHGDTADPAALSGYLAAYDAIERSPVEALYVAEWDGVVAGTFKTSELTTLTGRGSRSLVVQTVHVRADLRGRGIGHEMMRYCITTAQEAGIASVSLTTNAGRDDAHRFYERLGFERTHFGYKMRFN